MKTTVTTIYLLLTLHSLLVAGEAKPDLGKIFSYPDAVISMSGNGWSGHADPAKCFQRQEKPEKSNWTFRSGLGKAEAKGDSEFIKWHFINKTEYGDLYIVTFGFPNSTQDVVPIIYNGNRPATITRKGLRFEISEPNKK